MKTDESRLKNSIINMFTASIAYVATMIMTIFVRGFLVYYLGQRYVGLNGVMTSVLSSFSLADLGIDSVLVFLLFSPLEQKKISAVKRLMILFRKIYFSIGVIFFLVGLIAIPFFTQIFGSQAASIPNFLTIYLIFLTNAGVSYFFVYYRTLLNADQQSFVVARITLVVNVLIGVVQIFCLVFLKSFIIYGVVQLTGTVLTNLVIELTARRKYSFLSVKLPREETKTDKSTIKVLIKNTIGGISNKIGTVIVVSSDNILLAHFENLSVVGIYSNYMLIVQGISAFFSKIISSTTATLGNFGVAASPQKNLHLFSQVNFILNVIIALIIFPLTLCFSAFIRLWTGVGSVLPLFSVLLIIVNFILQIQRYPSLTFIDAFGLQWVQKWKSVFESLINIVVSLVLLISFKLGLVGVLLGTFASTVLVVSWYEPYIVLRHVCGQQYRKFIKQFCTFWILFVVQLFVSFILLNSFLSEISFVFSLLISLVFELLICIFIFFIFRKNENFQIVKRLLAKGEK